MLAERGQMKENWGKEGMPPVFHEVLSKRTIYKSKDYQVDEYVIEGWWAHLGRLFKGLTGNETKVTKVTYQGETRVKKV